MVIDLTEFERRELLNSTISMLAGLYKDKHVRAEELRQWEDLRDKLIRAQQSAT